MTALEDMMTVLNKTSTKFVFPTSKYKLLQEIENNIKTQYYVKCPKCKAYRENDKKKSNPFDCECGTTIKADENNFFVYMSIMDQLTSEMSKHAEHVHKFYKDVINTETEYCNRGSTLKGLVEKTFPNIPLPLQIFTDGLQVHKSSKNSLWPINNSSGLPAAQSQI